MMHGLMDWLDHRTGIRRHMRRVLYENIPGGARWQYVWGSTLAFVFGVQVMTGLVLWMNYSPSAQSAWESVYFIQYRMTLGWLLRGIHHYSAQAMVVLLAFHFLQVVLAGAYRAPREINFWLGLLLSQIILGLALTGYLLPWDQKGYWATKVATNIVGLIPLAGPWLQELAVGGPEYGHLTLTRFFALHAGVLPMSLVVVLAMHLTLFRHHGVTAIRPDRRPAQYFWPYQVLKDALAVLGVLAVVIALTVFAGAELGAPADPGENYNAARPEWYFLFLFQFLKIFHGETQEVIGAIGIPAAVLVVLFLMPLMGISRWGHRLNVALVVTLLAVATCLTGGALYEDYHARWTADSAFDDVREVLHVIEVDLRKNAADSKFHGLSQDEQVAAYFQDNAEKTQAFRKRLDKYHAYQKSKSHIEAVAEAHQNAKRATELAKGGIPPTGSLTLMRSDPLTQGPKLFRKHCASCHNHVDDEGNGIRVERPLRYDENGEPIRNGGSNLYRFASRRWIRGILDPDRISAVTHDEQDMLVRDAPYFGNTSHYDGEMAESFVKVELVDLDAEEQADIDRAADALSAEGNLPYQAEADEKSRRDGTLEQGRQSIMDQCTLCHKFGEEGELGIAPDLTNYGSRQWMIEFISDPTHERFYGENNDRMPSFAADADDPRQNLLDRESLKLIVDWLREDWPRSGTD